ncbi:MAG: hypothetical protein ACRET2_16120 [Steroidobacteraceae bacterium]
MDAIDVHQRHADAVRGAVIGEAAETELHLRTGAMASGAATAPKTAIPEPYDTLARQIAEAAHRVTDGQVAAVRAATGSDKAAFEIILSACIGAGLARWDAAVQAIEEAGDASA